MRLPGLERAGVEERRPRRLWLLFLGAYLGICAVMSRVASGRPSPLEVARSFALTLVPIAIGYHVAHYLVFLLVQGQYIIPLLSDPFGRGWDLFGTAGYRVDIAVAGARFAWYTAVAAIVTGHVFAVYLAHRRAIAVFSPTRVALATQVPLTALMVLYTFIGLSITAEPIVESRAAGEPVRRERSRRDPCRRASCPRRKAAGCCRWGPTRAPGQAHLQGAGLGLPRRHQDERRRYPLRLCLRLSLGRARQRRTARTTTPIIDAATAPLRRHLLGVRVAGVDAASKSFRVGDVDFVREIFTVEVYLDIAPEAPEWSAVMAPPWSTLPWHGAGADGGGG